MRDEVGGLMHTWSVCTFPNMVTLASIDEKYSYGYHWLTALYISDTTLSVYWLTFISKHGNISQTGNLN
jgi:hypothetical protein